MSKFAPHRRSTNNPRATSSTICQKCLGTGHYIFDCKSTRPYVTRPSRTQLLENPKSLAKFTAASGKPSVEVPEEFKNKSGTANKILEAKEKEREMKHETSKGKEKRRSHKKAKRSDSSSDSSTSDSSSSDSDSSSSSTSSSSDSDSGSSQSRGRSHKRRRRRSPSRSRSSGPSVSY